MLIDIKSIIYGYILLCLILLLYNLLYIFRSKGRNRKLSRTADNWRLEIEKQLARYADGRDADPAHKHRMRNKLMHTNSLLAYGTALDQIPEKNQSLLELYMRGNLSTLQLLASDYKKKDSMDRAYFAYLLSRHSPCNGNDYLPIMEALLSFLDNSTIYCRENVLQALYAFGNCQALETAFQIFNDRQWFHHQKLLSDGLLSFRGDKNALAERLWLHYRNWSSNLNLSVILFISGFSDRYKEIFLPILAQQETDLEIQLAIIRYYRHHLYKPAKPFLLSCLTDADRNESLAIVAASVLSSYPGNDTIAILKQALHHSNWYVRYNAAVTLSGFYLSTKELQDILEGNDMYAKEILGYMLEDQKIKSGKEGE